MHVGQFLQQLGNELGVADLAYNTESVSRLIVGNEMVIDLEYLEDRQIIQVYSALGSPSTGEEAWRELLAANLFGSGTGGATLALDEEQEEILLCMTFDLETLDLTRSLQELNAFADAAAF